ncbi:MAG: hypothetical protein M3Y59_07620 [Myxococcota bacterium]|nr:hypothetical protein [Myxococcota bacterium]
MGVNGTGSSSNNRDYNVRQAERRTGNEVNPPAAPTGPTNSGGVEYSHSDSFEADAGLRAETSGTGPGGVNYEGYVAGPSFSASSGVEGSIDSSGVHLDLNVDIDATLAEAGGEATRTFTTEVYGEEIEIELSLEALGEIGANGSVNLSIDIGTDGVNISASAEGFAGAQASLTGGISISHEGTEIASGEAEISATAGVGGSADANVDISGSEISFGASASASVGLGLGFEVSGTIDTQAAASAVLEIGAAALREGVEEVAEFVGEFGGEVVDFVGDRAEEVIDVAEDVGGFVLDAGEAVWDAGGDVVDFVTSPSDWF